MSIFNLFYIVGFPVILNYFRRKGVFGTGKSPNAPAQRHCDKCFTSYKRITKSVIGEAPNRRANGDKSVKQRSDVLLGSDLDLKCLQRLSADNTSRHSHFLLSAGSTHPNITEKLLTRFNSLPHIFPHCEITSMQKVFHGHHNWVVISNEYALSVPFTWKACLCFDKIGCNKRISH